MPRALENPLGWCWLIMGVLTVVLCRRPTRRCGAILACLCIVLTAFGGTPLSAWLLSTLERSHTWTAAGRLGRVDAIVVLGGSYSVSADEPAGFKVNSSFDRITTGLALVDLGLSTNLVLGGGIPVEGTSSMHDGEALRPWLGKRVHASTRVLVIESSTTTREEAVHFATMATGKGWHRIALVTSGSHLPRAVAVFEGQGIEVEPIGCAFEGLTRLSSVNRWTLVPNPGDLRLAGMWFHEMMGRLYYRLRGWSN